MLSPPGLGRQAYVSGDVMKVPAGYMGVDSCGLPQGCAPAVFQGFRRHGGPAWRQAAAVRRP